MGIRVEEVDDLVVYAALAPMAEFSEIAGRPRQFNTIS
jgi:hypothetical protein